MSKALVPAAVIGSIAVNTVMMVTGTALPTAVVPSMRAAVAAEVMPAAEARAQRVPSNRSHITTVAAAANTTRASSFWPFSI